MCVCLYVCVVRSALLDPLYNSKDKKDQSLDLCKLKICDFFLSLSGLLKFVILETIVLSMLKVDSAV